MRKHLITCSCFLLLCVLLVLCLFGGLKVNANQSSLLKYEIKYELTENRNNIFIFQVPNNQYIIENDSHNYAQLKVSFNNNTESDFLSVVRSGTDSFNIYGYYGTNYQKSITAYQFFVVNIYIDNTSCYLYVYIYEFDTSTNRLEKVDEIINHSDIGTYYAGKYVKTYGLCYGHFNEYNATAFNDSQIKSYVNGVIGPQLGDIVDAVGSQAYNRGYGAGYSQGYTDGEGTITPFDRFWSILTGVFSSVGAVLSINLFPGVPLGIFILIPLFFGAVGLILWIWRRN